MTTSFAVISGCTKASSWTKFRDLVNDSVMFAVAPSADYVVFEQATCIDLTSNSGASAAEALRDTLPRISRALVWDHQLENQALTSLLVNRNLRTMVLNTEIDYDTDPEWIISRLRWAQERVPVERFVVDIFCSVENSWGMLQSIEGDEFSVHDLESICRQFPIILAANISVDNCREIFAFGKAQGLLLTCDELEPVQPAERHAVSINTAREILVALHGSGQLHNLGG